MKFNHFKFESDLQTLLIYINMRDKDLWKKLREYTSDSQPKFPVFWERETSFFGYIEIPKENKVIVHSILCQYSIDRTFEAFLDFHKTSNPESYIFNPNQEDRLKWREYKELYKERLIQKETN